MFVFGSGRSLHMCPTLQRRPSTLVGVVGRLEDSWMGLYRACDEDYVDMCGVGEAI